MTIETEILSTAHSHAGSVEQYTSYVVIPQYCFLIASNILNTVIVFVQLMASIKPPKM